LFALVFEWLTHDRKARIHQLGQPLHQFRRFRLRQDQRQPGFPFAVEAETGAAIR
jgi:hypothetical protein